MSKSLPPGWRRLRLGELIREVSIRRGIADQHLSVLSVTNSQGFVRSADYFEGTVHSNDLSKYKVVRSNQFAYNPSRINVGSLARLANGEEGVVSPMYVVFEVTSRELEPELKQLPGRLSESSKSA